MTIGSALRSLRQAAGLSQRDLAEKAGISPSYLSLIESDQRDPSLSLVRELATILGTPATILFAAALGGDLGKQGRHREADIIQRLIEAERLNLLQEQLALGPAPKE